MGWEDACCDGSVDASLSGNEGWRSKLPKLHLFLDFVHCMQGLRACLRLQRIFAVWGFPQNTHSELHLRMLCRPSVDVELFSVISYPLAELIESFLECVAYITRQLMQPIGQDASSLVGCSVFDCNNMFVEDILSDEFMHQGIVSMGL